VACAKFSNWHNTRSQMLKCWNYPTNQVTPTLQGRLHGIRKSSFGQQHQEKLHYCNKQT
jgi:hypothetical protein